MNATTTTKPSSLQEAAATEPLAAAAEPRAAEARAEATAPQPVAPPQPVAAPPQSPTEPRAAEGATDAVESAYLRGYLRGLNEKAAAELRKPDAGEEPYPDGQHGEPVVPDSFFLPEPYSVWNDQQ